ncbi:MAG: hypothetical protein MUP30_05590 [Deltaproteobacteria bacterium]|nr:hypothetical protein [Deltaproteobacteria bacterium]
MKKSWSKVGLLILAGVVAVTVTLAPSAALAKEFSYSGSPAFTVTYPDTWAQKPQNPDKTIFFEAELAGGLPNVEIGGFAAPAGTTLANVGAVHKKNIARRFETSVTITSDKQATLKDGTPCNEVILTWMYRGWLALQTNIVSTIKDGKVVYVSVSQNPGDPLWDAGRSLKLKK